MSNCRTWIYWKFLGSNPHHSSTISFDHINQHYSKSTITNSLKNFIFNNIENFCLVPMLVFGIFGVVRELWLLRWTDCWFCWIVFLKKIGKFRWIWGRKWVLSFCPPPRETCARSRALKIPTNYNRKLITATSFEFS